MVGSGLVRTGEISACISILCHLGQFTYFCLEMIVLTYNSFKLKTKEQRAAEKALMDKSPLNTLTLEDFLESERHKLTGTLTPVTPESFAEWKKKRLDKKAAEEEAKRMKEATGRAMFERGDWDVSEDEDGETNNDVWNLEAMRRETEAARQQKEEERLAALSGNPVVPTTIAEEPTAEASSSSST
jgi:hypothetical protein